MVLTDPLKSCHNLCLEELLGPCSSAGRSLCGVPVWLFRGRALRAQTGTPGWLVAVCMFHAQRPLWEGLLLSFILDERSGFECLVHQEGICQPKDVGQHHLSPARGVSFPTVPLCSWAAAAV